jgi:hypothetical protein
MQKQKRNEFRAERKHIRNKNKLQASPPISEHANQKTNATGQQPNRIAKSWKH